MATLIVVEDLAAPASLGRGGHAMYVLQWLHALERLGHHVLFLEFLREDPGSGRASSSSRTPATPTCGRRAATRRTCTGSTTSISRSAATSARPAARCRRWASAGAPPGTR